MDAIKRKSRLLERGITWRPHHDSHYVVADMLVSARQALPLCIVQRTLLAVEEHLARSGPSCRYGLLTGQLCECSRTDRPYVVIDGSRECPPCHDGHQLHARLALGLSRQIDEAERSGDVVIGYYRGAATVVPRPSPSDVALLQALFPYPWQAMLLRDGAATGGAGAFIRVEPTQARAYAAPFLELLPAVRRRAAAGPPQSAVAWDNYDPREAVTRPSAPGDGARWHLDSPTPGERQGSGRHRRVFEVVRGLAGRQGGAPRPSSPRPASAPQPGQGAPAADRVADAAVPRRVAASADLRPRWAVLHAAPEPWPPSGCAEPTPGSTAARVVPVPIGMPPRMPGHPPSPPTVFSPPPMPMTSRGGVVAPPVVEAPPAMGGYHIASTRAATEPRAALRLARSADVASRSMLPGSAVPYVEQTRPFGSPPFVAPVPSASSTVAVAERSSSPPLGSAVVEERDVPPPADRRGTGAMFVTGSATPAARAVGVPLPTALADSQAVAGSGLPVLLPPEESDADSWPQGASRLVVAAIAVLLAIAIAASAWMA